MLLERQENDPIVAPNGVLGEERGYARRTRIKGEKR